MFYSSCRPVNWPFWFGFVAPFIIIYIFNWVMFILIMVSLCRHSAGIVKKTDTSNWCTVLGRHLLIALILSVMFGFGWIFGLIGTSLLREELGAFSTASQYIFSIFIAFQGVLLFIFHAIRSPESREEWKKWYYTITCRRAQYNVALVASLSGTSTTRRFTYSSTQQSESKPFTPRTMDDPATQTAMEENTIGFDNPAYEDASATKKVDLTKEDGDPDKDKATKL